MKIIQIIGARPQFIKAAAIFSALGNKPEINHLLLHTGQHFDAQMSDVFFSELNLPEPDFNLGINRLPHGAMTGRMMEGIERILIEEKPDWVIVHGDTNSTLAGALAAAKLAIPIAHVEAGLRSGQTNQPEEINRGLTDRLSQMLLCPTKKSVDNLRFEGMSQFGKKIYCVGDVMYDVWKQNKHKFQLPKIQLPERFALLTLHRQENLENPIRLRQLMKALEEVNNQLPIVFLKHPHTEKRLLEYQLPICFLSLPPQSYLKTMALLNASDILLTDSGGLQKEAYWSEKKCLILRTETEWLELLETGMSVLALPLHENLFEKVSHLLSLPGNFTNQPYGNGDASSKIIDLLLTSN